VTVSQYIEALKQLPQEAEVVTGEAEYGGFTVDFYAAAPVLVTGDSYHDNRYGEPAPHYEMQCPSCADGRPMLPALVLIGPAK